MAALSVKSFFRHVVRLQTRVVSCHYRCLSTELFSDFCGNCQSIPNRFDSSLPSSFRRPFNVFTRRTLSTKKVAMPYSIVERGTSNTTDYRIYFKNDDTGAYVSPFHDIPLLASELPGLYNMVVEIPRWTNHKMEISRDDPLNPIKQDIKKEKPRYVPNIFPHHGYIWNYGALPQTWENPEVKDQHTGYLGDNDPIDAIEIGSRVAKRGEVLHVKILGVIALIDEGETDWKVVTINKKDPLFDSLNDINDVEKHFPGLLKATIEWLKMYKIPDSKPENQFAFNGEFKNEAFATKIVRETHEHWKSLVSRDEAKINLMNTSLNDGKNTIAVKEAEQIVESTPNHAAGEPVGDSVGHWHFLPLK